MDAPNTDVYAIIYAPYGGTAIALGEEIGTVTHPDINHGLPIDVTNQVTDVNVPIAPIGDSGGNFDAHIHLYNFHTDFNHNDHDSHYSQSGFFATGFRNPKNPLQFLTHTEPTYTVAINGKNLVYPGTSTSSFRVRCSMNGSPSGSRYGNAVMNLDDVELYIKKDYQHISNYELIKGATLESRISHGGRLASDRYPSIGFPANNVGANAIDIARGVRNGDEGIGSFTRTGISASAYSSNPWDDFYFSDFPTRIHENDNVGGANARFAGSNKVARYPDGQYHLYAKATTVRDAVHNSSIIAPTSFIIDNFRPYIEAVFLSTPTKTFYQMDWSWDDDAGKANRTILFDGAANTKEKIAFTVGTSEPMKNMKVSIPSLGIIDKALTAYPPGANNQIWVLELPAQSKVGFHTLSFEGTDYAGNALEKQPYDTPIRQSATTWLPAPNPGADETHFLRIDNGGTCTPKVTNVIVARPGARTAARTDVTCLTVAFRADLTTPVVGERIAFTPMVSGGDGSAFTHSWNFGEGASPQTSTSATPPLVSYATAGAKTVSLEVCDGLGCIVETQVGFINVSSAPTGNTPLNVEFTASKLNAKEGDALLFTSQVQGGEGSRTYFWSFGEGASPATSSASNPQITYTTAGSKTVSLTVTDLNGRVMETKNNYVSITSSSTHPIEANFAGCVSSAQQDGIIAFTDMSFGGNGAPYDSYLWDFGDGSTSSSRNPSHKYAAMGSYTVSLTVCDEYGCNTKVSNNCVNVNIGPGLLNPNFLINGRSFETGDIPIIVGLNTPVQFTNTTTSPYQTTFAYYWQFNALSDGGTSYAVPGEAYTPGPHHMYYTAPGLYNVSLEAATEDRSLVRTKTKQKAIKVEAGRGSGGCIANIGPVTLTTSCWKKGGPYPKFNVPVQANCPIAEIYIAGQDEEQIINGELSFSWRNTPPTFPYTQKYKIFVYQFDGVKKNLLTQKEVTFTLNAIEQANAGPDVQLCLGTNAQLGSDGATGLRYTWSASPASALAYLSGTDSPSPIFDATVPGTFTYTLQVQDMNNGCTTSDQVRIEVGNALLATGNTYTVHIGNALTLGVNASGGTGVYTYAWEPTEHLDNPSKPNPVMIAPAGEGIMLYDVFVTDALGCTTVSQVTVNISATAPSSLVASTVSNSQIHLAWQDNSTNETAFVLERSIGDNTHFVPIATLPANTTSYEDLCLNSQKRYYYRMYASNGNGSVEYSNEVNASTLRPITKQWDRRFAESWNVDDILANAVPTADGGYILGGSSNSGFKVPGPFRYYVVKIDANGTQQWERLYGGNKNSYMADLQQTSDGGYILAGHTLSGAANDVSEPPIGGLTDMWIVKLDAKGAIQWDRRLGTEYDDVLYSIQQTQDGGYILGGNLLIKVDALGKKEWEQRYDFTSQKPGTIDPEWFQSYFINQVLQVDGGYVWFGKYLVKTDTHGNTIWSKNYKGYSFDKTTDGGFILADDAYILRMSVRKVDMNGVHQWQKSYGSDYGEFMHKVIATKDGQYLVGALSRDDYTPDRSEPIPGFHGMWLLKIDASGIKQWDKTYTGNGKPGGWGGRFQSLHQAKDGGYLVGGFTTNSKGVDISEPTFGGIDYWVVKTSSEMISASCTPPTAPSNLTATAASCTQINLSWVDQSSNETHFILERSTTSGGTFEAIATLDPNSTKYQDVNLSLEATYYYRVKAINPAHSSAYSNEASATSNVTALTTNTTARTTYVPGESISVPFTVTCGVQSGNVFTVQLSDAFGSFANPVSIGTWSGTSSATIVATLPGNTPAGNGYRVRVIASQPAVTGTDNGVNLQLHFSYITTSPDVSICAGSATVLTASLGNSTNNALRFDGVDDYVQVGDKASLKMSTAITLEAWIYPTGPGSNGGEGGIIINKEGEYGMWRRPNGEIWWAIGRANTNNVWDLASTGAVAPLNTWTHVALTYQSGLIRVYMNGKLVQSSSSSATAGDCILSLNDFRIGGRQVISHYFAGTIDEVRVWNIARSQTQIQTWLNSSVSTNTTGLVGYWQFNEAQGTLAGDATANTNVGTLLNGANWLASSAPVYPAAFSWSPVTGLNKTTGISVTATPSQTTTYTVTTTDLDGATQTKQLTISVQSAPCSRTMNGKENNFNSENRVYPNPTDGIVYWSNEDFYSAKVWDVTGRLILTQEKKDQKMPNIKLDSLPNGVYQVQLSNGKEARMYKVVIAK